MPRSQAYRGALPPLLHPYLHYVPSGRSGCAAADQGHRHAASDWSGPPASIELRDRQAYRLHLLRSSHLAAVAEGARRPNDLRSRSGQWATARTDRCVCRVVERDWQHVEVGLRFAAVVEERAENGGDEVGLRFAAVVEERAENGGDEVGDGVGAALICREPRTSAAL
jgi:hypothetical protein